MELPDTKHTITVKPFWTTAVVALNLLERKEVMEERKVVRENTKAEDVARGTMMVQRRLSTVVTGRTVRTCLNMVTATFGILRKSSIC